MHGPSHQVPQRCRAATVIAAGCRTVVRPVGGLRRVRREGGHATLVQRRGAHEAAKEAGGRRALLRFRWRRRLRGPTVWRVGRLPGPSTRPGEQRLGHILEVRHCRPQGLHGQGVGLARHARERRREQTQLCSSREGSERRQVRRVGRTGARHLCQQSGPRVAPARLKRSHRLGVCSTHEAVSDPRAHERCAPLQLALRLAARKLADGGVQMPPA